MIGASGMANELEHLMIEHLTIVLLALNLTALAVYAAGLLWEAIT